MHSQTFRPGEDLVQSILGSTACGKLLCVKDETFVPTSDSTSCGVIVQLAATKSPVSLFRFKYTPMWPPKDVGYHVFDWHYSDIQLHSYAPKPRTVRTSPVFYRQHNHNLAQKVRTRFLLMLDTDNKTDHHLSTLQAEFIAPFLGQSTSSKAAKGRCI